MLIISGLYILVYTSYPIILHNYIYFYILQYYNNLLCNIPGLKYCRFMLKFMTKEGSRMVGERGNKK